MKPDAAAPVQATGIDYLRLLEAAHQQQVGRAINFTALREATEAPGHPQDGPVQS